MPKKSNIMDVFSEACKAAGIKAGTRVVVACSGGSDSMALALIAKQWASKQKAALVVVTVDHGLRTESAAEAKQVGAWLKKHGIKHHILRWEGKKPSSNRQEAAREARYNLLADYAKEWGATHVLVAHTRDDQAETFLLRLMRGSGVDGLAAIAPIKQLYGVTVLRPLLGCSRQELQKYLAAHKQIFIHDPSNEDVRYDRVRMRKIRPLLVGVGITDERLVATARNMARARDFLERETQAFLRENAVFHPFGYAELSGAVLCEHDEIMLRALSDIIRLIGGQKVPLRLEENERLLAALREKNFRGATLAGVVIAPYKNKILFYRELRAVEKPVLLKPDAPLLWDGRFLLTLKETQKKLYVGALTQAGWLEVAKKYKLVSTVPDKRILYTLPSLRDAKGNIIAVPHLGVEGAICFVAQKAQAAGCAPLVPKA